jgi:hypothetical protein
VLPRHVSTLSAKHVVQMWVPSATVTSVTSTLIVHLGHAWKGCALPVQKTREHYVMDSHAHLTLIALLIHAQMENVLLVLSTKIKDVMETYVAVILIVPITIV